MSFVKAKVFNLEDEVSKLNSSIEQKLPKRYTAAEDGKALIIGGANHEATPMTMPQGTVVIDPTLTIAGQAADAEATGIGLARFNDLLEKKVCNNRLDLTTLTDGKYVIPFNGRLDNNEHYAATDYMKVESGETYTLQCAISGGRSVDTIAFMAGYDADKNYVQNSGAESVNRYTVPVGVEYVRVSNLGLHSYPERNYSFNRSEEVVPYIPYFDDYYVISEEHLPMQEIVESVREEIVEAKSGAIVGRLANGETDDSVEITVPNCKKNHTLGFHANIDEFGEMQIGQGTNSFGQTGYIVIDDTTIKVYAYEGSLVEKLSEPHNLTFTDYIDVTIVKTENDLIYGKIMIATNGGTYTKDNVWFRSANANAYAKVLSGVYSDMVLTYTSLDFEKKTWIFGDSYFDHWLPQLIGNGLFNFYCDGYSGRNSAAAMNSLSVALQHGTPNQVVWFMGMNDGDTENAVNANWKLNYDLLIAKCEEKNIVPVLCTIPNTPSVNNKFKNAIIRESGYRYIDMAKAVGSDKSVNWFDGLLSNDNVHPSADGDMMIARFIAATVPELR